MTDEDGGTREGIGGLPLAEAVDTVLERGDADDREAVRATLSEVTEDGVVTWDGVEAALAHASKVVSTPETRTELASMELSDAREQAEPHTEVAAVRSRLETFEGRMERIEERTAALGEDLQSLVGRDDDIYAVAAGIRRLTVEANRVQGTADELATDLQEFQRWLGSPAYRYDELTEDVARAEESIDELAAVTEHLSTAVMEAGAADPESEAALSWLDATLQRRVLTLLVVDLRAELADIRALPGDESERAAELDERLADHEARLDDLEERLAGLALPAWEDRHADRTREFETTLDGFEPPVDWGAVHDEQAVVRPDGPE
jgi:chromosome segregation ATPase